MMIFDDSKPDQIEIINKKIDIVNKSNGVNFL